MKKVGLTGGIGSGKSMASKVFRTLGIPVYNSDTMAKYLMNNSPVIKSKLIDKFGVEVYDDAGILNNSILAKEVFSNKQKLNILNSIVHPEVRKNFQEWLLSNSNSPYIIKEAAILIESGSYKDKDNGKEVSETNTVENKVENKVEENGKDDYKNDSFDKFLSSEESDLIK